MPFDNYLNVSSVIVRPKTGNLSSDKGPPRLSHEGVSAGQISITLSELRWRNGRGTARTRFDDLINLVQIISGTFRHSWAHVIIFHRSFDDTGVIFDDLVHRTVGEGGWFRDSSRVAKIRATKCSRSSSRVAFGRLSELVRTIFPS